MRIEPWSKHLDLQTPAALALKRLAAALPSNRQFRIVVFGSAPLQLEIEPLLLSGDVDVFSDNEDLADYVKMAGLGCENNRPGIAVSSELNFLTSAVARACAKLPVRLLHIHCATSLGCSDCEAESP